MKKQSIRVAKLWLMTAATAVFMAGCSSTPDKKSERDNAETLYAAAREEMASGANDQAIKQYEELQSRYPFGRVAQQALLEQAYAQYRSGERELALDSLQRFLKQNPSHPFADYAMYLRGVIYFNDKQGITGWIAPQDPSERDPKALRDAYDAFNELVTKYPESRYADDARIRLSWLYNAIAANEVHVARYYFRRGAWLAAANRAQGAVRDYQQAPVAEQALYIMIQSYEKLGLKNLREDAERVLQQNYPNSPILKNGLPTAESQWWQLW